MVKILQGICLVLICSLCSCKKDKSASTCNCPTNGNICTDTDFPKIPSGGYFSGYSFIYDTGYVEFPYFNPNNASEIIYYKPHCASGPATQLIKFNILTQQRQVLFTQPILDAPKWGRNGWILIGSQGQIYKIKDNGDSLAQITFGSANYSPEWNYVGDKFITEHANSVTSISYNYMIYDANGNPLDTLTYPYNGDACWQNPGNLLLVGLPNNAYGLGVLNTITDSLTPVLNVSSQSGNNGPAFWFPDNISILYGTSCGVYKLNYQSGAQTCLQSKCSNDQYPYTCISSISQKIIYEIDHQKYIGNTEILITSKLVLMNFDGSGQQVISLH